MANFMTMGEALDKAIEAAGPDLKESFLDALETILEYAIIGGLADPAKGIIEDFIANNTD